MYLKLLYLIFVYAYTGCPDSYLAQGVGDLTYDTVVVGQLVLYCGSECGPSTSVWVLYTHLLTCKQSVQITVIYSVVFVIWYMYMFWLYLNITTHLHVRHWPFIFGATVYYIKLSNKSHCHLSTHIIVCLFICKTSQL